MFEYTSDKIKAGWKPEDIVELALSENKKHDKPIAESDVLKMIEQLVSYRETETLSDVANCYLQEHFDTETMLHTIIYYNSDFYMYDGQVYNKLDQAVVRSDIVQILDVSRSRKSASDGNIRTVLNYIKSIKTIIPSDLKIPTWRHGSNDESDHYLSLNNAILNVSALTSGKGAILQKHSPSFITFSSHNFNYDQNKECPNFQKFLREIQPEDDVRTFLQEWLGYQLIHDTRQERMVIFAGEGANGKSSLLTIFKMIIGKNNVSSVGLEAFDINRTFPIASTRYKLSNIVDELSDIDKKNEGVIKSFITGSPLTVEHKGKNPFVMVPSARLTFATNTLPRIKDKSDGLWRKLVVIPFNFQVLDPSKQDRRLGSEKYWIESGEIDGIFNWAIEGLKRLLKRGYLIEPQVAVNLKRETNLAMNPAKQFLQEHITLDPKGVVPTNHLYQKYRQFCDINGTRSLSNVQFTKELRRCFTNIEISKNAIKTVFGDRSRVVYGISLNDQSDIDLDSVG